MKLFSRITFICNISFLAFIILGYIEFNNKTSKDGDKIIRLPFLTGTMVILGQSAIFINLVFCIISLTILLRKKILKVPQWLVIANFIFFLVQVYYFFIY